MKHIPKLLPKHNAVLFCHKQVHGVNGVCLNTSLHASVSHPGLIPSNIPGICDPSLYPLTISAATAIPVNEIYHT